jgi:uncharacterized protein (DUF2237 family)
MAIDTPPPGNSTLRTTRWQETFEADASLCVVLGATHEKTLEIVEVANLKRYALAWPK